MSYRRARAQLEEKKYAHRRGSDATTASRPMNILNSPLMMTVAPLDAQSDAGSAVGSYKLPAIHESAFRDQLPPPAMQDGPGRSTTPIPEIPGVIHGARVHCDHCLSLADRCDEDGVMLSEFTSIFESFRKCLELRDKYMTVSGQMLGFNPKDHDGHFTGLDPHVADVTGVRPDVDFATAVEQTSPFNPWKIYPKPPPPHWHWADKGAVPHKPTDPEDEEFIFENCEIPGPDTWGFEIDERGVFQVYSAVEGELVNSFVVRSLSLSMSLAQDKKPIFNIPTIREYFVDLEYVLGVISDGPTKSFAFRRIGYLSSKFTMYQLLNEFQELADMKVRAVLPVCLTCPDSRSWS